ncbi:MAG: hypothetical protein C4326_08415 [Ignavibacteria bacterium]
MSEVVVRLPSIEPGRRPRFDYTGTHRYLITLPVFADRRVFVERQRVLTVLHALRDSALVHRFDVYAYCFLPSDLTLVVRGKDTKANLKEFLRAFRLLSSNAMTQELGHTLWKKKYFERVLRKNEETRAIVASVFERPVKAGLIKQASQYPYQGSFVLVPKKQYRR